MIQQHQNGDNNYDDNQSTSTSTSTSQGLFCQGMSMTMSMSGFQSALFGTTHPADCLTYLFTNWRLDSVGKFQGAMSEFESGRIK
jgi:hypothetical protein